MKITSMLKKPQVLTWLNNHVPLGKNGKVVTDVMTAGLIGAFVFHFFSFNLYFEECLRTAHYNFDYTKMMEQKDESFSAYMPTFIEMMSRNWFLFILFALLMLVLAAYNYRYHFQGSRSIYLMKRLPDNKDLARRCLTIPLLGILACILVAALLTGICYLIYAATPLDIYIMTKGA